MTTPFLCILALAVVTYLAKLPTIKALASMGYDNRNPRDQQAKLTGWGRRALAAHQNCFEAFPLFAAAVFIAHLTQADPTWSARLSIAFVVLRVLYVVLYVVDRAPLRSLVWFVGIVDCFALALLSTF